MVLMIATSPVVADKQKTSELPSLAFLEFLADMEMVEGKWVAPTDLLDAQNDTCAAEGTLGKEVTNDSGSATQSETEVNVQADPSKLSDNQNIE